MEPRSIHLALTHVHAADGRPAVASASAYIRDARGQELDTGGSIDAAIAYIRAAGHHKGANRVVATEFFCRGSHTSGRVWRALDDSFRTKQGHYSRRGGNTCRKGEDHRSAGKPRLAIFADATLPYDASEEQKLDIGRRVAEAHVERFSCAVEVAFHAKNGVIDHVHWLISSRVVDEAGVGPTVRAFNGIASKCEKEITRDGRILAGHAEWFREIYADMLTEATGVTYDPRSFARQGRAETPTPWVTRERIERESRLGTDEWRRDRREHLAQRAANQASVAEYRRDSLTPKSATIGTPIPICISPPNVAAVLIGAINVATPSPINLLPTRPGKDRTRSLDHIFDEELKAKIARENQDAVIRAEVADWIAEQQQMAAALTRRSAEARWPWAAQPGERARSDAYKEIRPAGLPLKSLGIPPFEEAHESSPRHKEPKSTPPHFFPDDNEDFDEKRRREKTRNQVEQHAKTKLEDEHNARRTNTIPIVTISDDADASLPTSRPIASARPEQPSRVVQPGQKITDNVPDVGGNRAIKQGSFTPLAEQKKSGISSSSANRETSPKSSGRSFKNRVTGFSEGYEQGSVDRTWYQGSKVGPITESKNESTLSRTTPVGEISAERPKELAADSAAKRLPRQPSAAPRSSRDFKIDVTPTPTASFAEHPVNKSNSNDVATKRKDAPHPKVVPQDDLRAVCVAIGAYYLRTRRIYYQKEELARIAALLPADYEVEVNRCFDTLRKADSKSLWLHIDAAVRNTNHPELVRLIGKSGRNDSEAPPVDQAKQQDRPVPHPLRNKTKTGQGL